MPVWKPLCRLCECPTADGAVRATQVDRVKLRNWALKSLESHGCKDELNEEIKDSDLICYFCIWQSQFMSRHDCAVDESLAWWPKKLNLDAATKELRKNFFGGEVDQCWVQLEKIALPENADSDQSDDEKSEPETQKAKECIYCKKSVKEMTKHITLNHKDAMRCDLKQCATYFRTLEEKKEHMKLAHPDWKFLGTEKVKVRRTKIECVIPLCKRTFTELSNYRRHVKNHHAEYSARCEFKGCLKYFKTEIELKNHNSSEHKIIKDLLEKRKPFKCEKCPVRTCTARNLRLHIEKKHLPKVLECDICKKMFATISVMRIHMIFVHVFKVCPKCNCKVKVYRFAAHACRSKCKFCRKIFTSTDLYQTHLKHCTDQNKILKCSGCNKQFKWQSVLQYHMKRCHACKYKHLGFQCELCRNYFDSNLSLERHINLTHTNRRYVFCAHCPRKYFHLAYLKDHLAKVHDLIEKNLQCADCPKSFGSKHALRYHQLKTHLKSMKRVECRICGKSCFTRFLKVHMLNIHDVK